MTSTPRRRLLAELAIAWRYLRSVREDALIRQLSRITVGGLALGVAALVLALSVLTGFQEQLLADVLGRSPVFQIETGAGAPAAELAAAILGVDGVASVQRMREGRGWLRLRGEVRPVQIVAYEDALPVWMGPVDRSGGSVVPGSEAESGAGLWVGRSLALAWGAAEGDALEIVTPRRTATPFGLKPASRRLPVRGFLSSGRVDEMVSDRVAMPLSAAEALLGPGAPVLDVGLAPGARREAVEEALAGLLEGRGDARLVTWHERHGALLFVLRLEKFAVFLAVTLIVLVASFALVSALALILSNKRQELGLLSAMGMSRRRLRRLFLLLGSMFAATGAFLGGASGVLISWLLDRFELIPLPADLYIIDHVPFALRGPELAAVLAATVTVTLVAAFFGARGATAWTPVEALRR